VTDYYGYVSHEVDQTGLTDGSRAYYMTVRVVTVTRRWLFWKRRTECTRDVFREPFTSHWRWLSNGRDVNPNFDNNLDEVFNGYVAADEARSRYEALLDAKIAVDEEPVDDPKVVRLRERRASPDSSPAPGPYAELVSRIARPSVPRVNPSPRKNGGS
jgi:hypothetical protein